MKNRTIAALVAVIALISVNTLSAQTAGDYSLDLLRDAIRHEFNYSLDQQGNRLVLTDRATSFEKVAVQVNPAGVLSMSAPIGKAILSGTDFVQFARQLLTINTQLRIGTIVIDSNGAVTLKHYVGIENVSIDRTVETLRILVDEASRQRALLHLS